MASFCVEDIVALNRSFSIKYELHYCSLLTIVFFVLVCSSFFFFFVRVFVALAKAHDFSHPVKLYLVSMAEKDGNQEMSTNKINANARNED